MRCTHRAIDYKHRTGLVNLIAEEPEDMWHTFNLIQIGDIFKSTTIRKVQTQSSTGSVANSKVRTLLSLRVEDIDFDTQACVLRVKGRNVEENQYVKMGAYHTIDLEMNRKFTLTKEDWDSVALERLDTACDPTQSADLAAVIMQEGLAYVCLVTSSMTLTRTKIELTIPRKRRGDCAQHDKGIKKFYEQVMQAIIRHVNFEVVKCVLVASPGFLRNQFFDWMIAEAVKTDNRLLMDNKSKFLLVHSSSGHKHALKELLSDPAVGARLSDTKATYEVRALDSFYQMLQMDANRAVYGYKHVNSANKLQAIEVLLISDELFRSRDVPTRKKYVALVDSVKENNGDVRIFSSLHVSGEQLGQLTGVAAVLRFPVDDELVCDSDSDSDS
ncbi:protein pelota homolog [Watersipora subatra]|uniref:protein pelota homolog n=1 Tax=Watersipora subatra TaxID=2589382 RepID=UPI00355B5E20